MNKSSLRLWTVFFCVFLSACTTFPTAIPLSNAQQVSELNQWQMRGKLAVITPEQKRAVNFYWQRNAQSYQTILTTTLGVTVFSAKRSINGILVNVDGKEYRSEKPNELLLALTGWHLPVDNFNQWLIADVTSDSGTIVRDKEGNIIEFKPACHITCNTKLIIQYGDYRMVNLLRLPHRIQIKHTDEFDQTQTFKLKISNWE